MLQFMLVKDLVPLAEEVWWGAVEDESVDEEECSVRDVGRDAAR